MDKIDPYCFFEILEQINLVDQISMSETCRSWDYLVQDWWKVYLKSIEWNFLTSSIPDDLFRAFLKKNSIWVEILKFTNIKAENVSMIIENNFLNAYDLQITQHNRFDIKGCDMKQLCNSFPKLTAFEAQGKFSGKYFAMWKNMQKLTLSSCNGLKLKYLREILNELTLKELNLGNFYFDAREIKRCGGNLHEIEKFLMNSHELALFTIDKSDNFKNLKIISINEYSMTDNIYKFFMLLDKYRFRDVRQLQLCDKENELLPFFLDLNFFSYLNCLTLKSYILHVSTVRRLRDFLIFRSPLTKLFFINIGALREHDILKLLVYDTNLDLFSVENCLFSCECIHINVERIMSARAKPLRFNFCNNINGIHYNNRVYIEIHGQNKLLTISEERLINVSFYVIHIELQAPDDSNNETEKSDKIENT